MNSTKDGEGVFSCIIGPDSKYTNTLEPDEGILLAHGDILYAPSLDTTCGICTYSQAIESLQSALENAQFHESAETPELGRKS